MARGPKPKKSKTDEQLIKDVAKDILQETQALSKSEVTKRVDEEFLKASQEIEQAVH